MANFSGPAAMVVAFRTHLWTPEIARLARRLRYFAQGAAFVVLMDETNGVVQAEDFTKLAHTSDPSGFGLPAYPPTRLLWYNADYALYHLRRAYPDATHYAMVEYDVAVNTDIMPMLRQAQAEKIDMIAYDIRPAGENWYWHDTVKKHFAAPLAAFIPFVVVSARAIDAMLRERRRIAANGAITPSSNRAEWPFCEALMPSAVALLDNASFRPLADFAQLPFFSFRPEQHIDDPLLNLHGTIGHPVAGGALFASRRLKKVSYDEVMDEHGPLRRQLGFCDPALFAEGLFNIVKKQRDPAKLRDFQALARARHWPLTQLTQNNLALFKPALMSSKWHGEPALELAAFAGGGNNGVIDGGFGFHTEEENEAWWQVDLEQPCIITHVLVFNRLDQRQRCRRLNVAGSADALSWQTLVEKRDDALFGGADGMPLVLSLRGHTVARHIRLTNLEHNYFHLDEVQVLGRPRA